MSYGFKLARTRRLKYCIKGAMDIDRHANATYQRMLGIEPLFADVNTLKSKSEIGRLLDLWGINRRQPLVVIGCAPCQGFSSHRKRYESEDQRNSLLVRFGQIVSAIRPNVVVMENVPEMLSREHWAFFANWKSRLEREGYTVRARVHNLAEFGVPQERFRALVIAARDWPSFRMPSPTHSPREFRTVRDAIGHLRPLRAGGCDPTDPMHVTSQHRKATIELIKLISANGGSQSDLPPGKGPKCLKVDGFRDVYGRMFWDRPANAITTRCRTPSAGRFAHPTQNRGLSVREAALLQGFPDDFYFEGPFDDKFKQIGNAVAPFFAQAIAEHLGSEWFRDHDLPVDTTGDIVRPINKSISSALASVKRQLQTSGLYRDTSELIAAKYAS
jgi:DNA (cytosine-5)-methyltransferase 1